MMQYVFTLDGAFGRSSRLKFEAATATQQCYGLAIDNESITVYGCGRTFENDRPVSWKVCLAGHEACATRNDGLRVVILPQPGSTITYDDDINQYKFIFTGGLLIPQMED